MRIGFDLLFLIPGRTGGRETYARELIAALFELEPSLSATGYINREASPAFARELAASMRVVRLPVSARRPEQWAFGEWLGVPMGGRRGGVDVMHSLANFGPASGPFRRVLTVHDLQYRALPELLPPGRRLGTAVLMSVAVRRAHRIIAVSAFARDELLRVFPVDASSVDVIPNGVGTRIVSAPLSESTLRDRHVLAARPVALTVASYLPHKNLEVLFEALARIEPGRRPVLVLAGLGTDAAALRARAIAAGVQNDVRLLGYSEPAELEGLYRLAACIVLPSRYEGFGLPVLEAMARNVPVLCSDIPSLRAVAGDAAVRFSPEDAGEIAAAIERVLGERGLAARLVEAGARQVRQFSWTRAAEATLQCYRRALPGNA